MKPVRKTGLGIPQSENKIKFVAENVVRSPFLFMINI